VIHNVGRFLEQCTETTIRVPANIRDGLALPYTELTASGKFEATDDEIGWLLMLIEKSDLNIALPDDKDGKKQEQKSPAPEPNDDGTVIGSGTGFVVAPGYVLTNEHVAMDGAAYEIQAPDGTRHKATRVAADAELDLALLKCEPLTAPPLVLHDRIVPRGTDVMLFGYPEMLVLGTSLKATRGSISSLPDPGVKSKYLYDAVSNAGNSGGPLCDAGANVVAVHSTGYNTASRYAGGVPSTQAIEFVKKALPEFKQSAPSVAKLEWPKVDERASASTMLVWIRRKNAAAETASVVGDVVELPFCLFCGGLGKMKCDNPVCREGSVTTKKGEIQCRTCEGLVVFTCQVCDGIGIDARLASVQRAAAAIVAAKAAKTDSPSTAGPSTSGTSSTASSTGPRMKPSTGATMPASMPPLASGGSVDLLAKVDPNQRYSPGCWSRRGTAITGGREDFARLAIPFQPPAEYDVVAEIRLLNSEGPNAPIFYTGLVSATGRQFHIAVQDTSVSISTGAGGMNGNSVSGVDLRQSTQVRYVVRRYEVNVLIDGERILHRRIDPDQTEALRNLELSGDDLRYPSFGSRGRRTEWEITSLSLVAVTAAEATTGPPPPPEAPPPPTFSRPAPPAAAGRPIDLLAKINPEQSYSPGLWKREGKAIVGGGVHYARFAVPHDPPREYDLVLDVQELKRASESTKSGLFVSLVSSSGKSFTLIVEDGFIGKSGDDGRGYSGNRVPALGLTKPCKLRFMIRTTEVALLVNGVRVYQRTIDPDKLMPLNRVGMSGDDAERLSIGSKEDGTEWRISGMTLIPLN